MIFINTDDEIQVPSVHYTSQYVVSIRIPPRWRAGIFTSTENFSAVGVFHLNKWDTVVKDCLWFFFTNNGTRWEEVKWVDLDDSRRALVRHVNWANFQRLLVKDAPWCPGGYEDDSWYTLEVLEDL